MDDTPNLNLPYLMAAQAQKHVTHNEALRALDAIVQLGVLDKDLGEPPASPLDGQRYIVGTPSSGAWSGQSARIAAFQDGAWAFYPAQAGWLAWVSDEGCLYAFDGTAWAQAAIRTVNPIALIGVNATANATNRLTVKSNSVLLSHDDVTPGTGDHRITVNKAAAARTGSLIFQTAFSGRSEIGATGDDDFRIKVSANGTTWNTALRIDAASGRVGLGQDNASDHLTVTNPNPSPGYAQVARFNVWNTGAGVTLTRLLVGQFSPNNMFMECADQANVKGNWNFQPYGGNVGIGTFSPPPERLTVNGNIAPAIDNAASCGTAVRRFSTIFAANGTINTSDARDKVVAKDCPPLAAIAGRLIDGIEPLLFRWKIGGNEYVSDGEDVVKHAEDSAPVRLPRYKIRARPGERIHAGFRAQDVKAALDGAGVDFGVWGLDEKSNPESRQWLRSEQLIPVLWQAVRDMRAELAMLRKRT